MRRADGTVLVYYVNGAAAATWVAKIVADTAQVLGTIVVDSVSSPNAIVDPDVSRPGVDVFPLSGETRILSHLTWRS